MVSNLVGIFVNKIIDTLTGEEGRRARNTIYPVIKDLAAYLILDHERYGSRIVLEDTKI